MRRAWVAGAAGLLAAGSVAAAPGAPGYDAWAWLVWGRELADGTLSTAEGPAWKPLPVLVAVGLAPLGDLAPEAWLVIARAAALLAVALAFAVGRRLAGTPAGVAGALGLALTGGWWRHAAVGDAEPLLVAALLLAVDRGLAGRHRTAAAAGLAAALLRPETWPLLAAAAAVLWRRDAAARPWLAASAAAVPVLWFGPELAASGELLRSAERARIPNPGQPATADRPALETLLTAAGVVFLPALLAAPAAGRRGLALAGAGLAWIVLVAAMSEAGFAGEARYLVPGAALLAVAGGVGLARLAASPGRRRAAAVALAVVCVAPAADRAREVSGLGPRLEHQQVLQRDLERVIAAGGGPRALLRCGRPYVGGYRGTLLAWHLRVPKRVVGFAPRVPGVVFRSRLTSTSRPAPSAPRAFRPAIAAPGWQVLTRCGRRRPAGAAPA